MPIKTRIDGNSKGVDARKAKLNYILNLEEWLELKIKALPTLEDEANAQQIDNTYSAFTSEYWEKKREEFEKEDEERERKLKPFRTKEHLTAEDLKEVKKYSLTDEEIEERAQCWKITSDAYHGLTQATSSLAQEGKRLDTEMNNPDAFSAEKFRNDDCVFYFFLLLAAGKAKAADYLSDCYDRGIGTNVEKTSDFHIDLALLIGDKLGDARCKTAMAGETLDDKRVEPCASACTSSILRNKAELGTHATFKDIIGRAKLLDQQIEQMSGESYFKTMTDEVWLSYVNDVEVIVTSDDVVMSGQSPEACCIIM